MTDKEFFYIAANKYGGCCLSQPKKRVIAGLLFVQYKLVKIDVYQWYAIMNRSIRLSHVGRRDDSNDVHSFIVRMGFTIVRIMN